MLSVDEPTLESLLVRSARGDETGFAEFYDRCSGAVYGLCRCTTGDAAAAQELASVVFVDIWRRCGGFDRAGGSALSWALDVTHEHAVRWRRERPAEPSAPEPPSTTPALRLPPAQRAALTQAYFGGRTYREVADLLGVTPAAVTILLHDGLGQVAAGTVPPAPGTG